MTQHPCGHISPRPPTHHPGQAVLEQLLEGASLTSEGHVAALLLLHPENHGKLFVSESTEAAAKSSGRLKEDAQWSPSSRNPLSVAAYSVLNSGEPVLDFCPEAGGKKWRMCPLKEKGGRTFGVLLSAVIDCHSNSGPAEPRRLAHPAIAPRSVRI